MSPRTTLIYPKPHWVNCGELPQEYGECAGRGWWCPDRGSQMRGCILQEKHDAWSCACQRLWKMKTAPHHPQPWPYPASHCVGRTEMKLRNFKGMIPHCPHYKHAALRHYLGHFYSVPFVRDRGTYSVLLTHDNLCKPTQVKQDVVPVILILSNICRAFTMYLCMDSVKFLLEAPDASILWGRYYFVTTCRLIWGVFLLGRALLLETLRYIIKLILWMFFSYFNHYNIILTWKMWKILIPSAQLNHHWNICINE